MHNSGPTSPTWRKSSYSGQTGNCVEVTADLPGIIAVRDSKNPTGAVLTFTPEQWRAFLTQIKHRG